MRERKDRACSAYKKHYPHILPPPFLSTCYSQDRDDTLMVVGICALVNEKMRERYMVHAGLVRLVLLYSPSPSRDPKRQGPAVPAHSYRVRGHCRAWQSMKEKAAREGQLLRMA